MIESHLEEGRQDIVPGQPLKRGVSVTDACISLAQTVPVLRTGRQRARLGRIGADQHQVHRRASGLAVVEHEEIVGVGRVQGNRPVAGRMRVGLDAQRAARRTSKAQVA
jgi:hypothetical protein